MMTFTTKDGTSLYADIDPADGRPFVFQHGLCGDADQTREITAPLAGIRRYTIEARGHGRSQSGDFASLSIATFTDDITAFIEKNFRQPVIVGGISMGAAISLRLACKRPDLVRALVLARPAWVFADAPDNMAPIAEVGRLLSTLPADQAKATFLAGDTAHMLAQIAPDNLASLTGFFTREPLPVTAALLAAISAGGPGVTLAEIAAISRPTLVLANDSDFIHPLDHARTLAGIIPGARCVEIPPKAIDRTAHVAAFQRELTCFIKELGEK